MQTFNLDISAKRIVPLLNVKQGDVGAKIAVVITNNGAAYTIPGNTVFSVWYSGAGGEGNYTTIGDKSAFSVSGNTVTVELILQMLQNKGAGQMCLVMNGADGSQLGLWNIPYFVEEIPGANSKEATAYYTAFLDAAIRAEAAAVRAEAAANSIVTTPGSVVGVEVTLNDAEDNSVFHGLKLYGKSTQDGAPSLENPVDVVHAGADGSIVVNVNDTQTLTALTPNGLPGIKVPKGGNYTDSNGQQRACDEVDGAAGVRRKWIDSYTFTGTETNLSYYSAGADVLPTLPLANVVGSFGNCMSNMLTGVTGYSDLMDNGNTVTTVSGAIVFHIAGYKGVGTTYPTHNDLRLAVLAKLKELADNGTPLTVYYQLATPIETPLSAEELAQYAALRTSSPTTTVSNNAGVGMEVSYYLPNAALPSSGGTVGGELNTAGNRITGLGEPIGDTDAVPKSYVSPAMLFGVEYLTNEMWNGNQIFAKLIDFGSLPVDASKSVTISNESIYAVGVEGFVDDRGNDPDVPVVYPLYLNSLGVGVYVGANSITVAKQGASSPYYAYFKVKYIKL